jgi:WD40 repeat protein
LWDGTLACGIQNGSISIWDIDTGAILRTLNGHTENIFCLNELSDGSLASGSGDYTIKLWNSQNGQLIRTLEGHTKGVKTLTQMKSGFLASGSSDKTIKIWNTSTGELISTIEIDEIVLSLEALRDGNLACLLKAKHLVLNPNETNGKILRTIDSKYENFNKHILLSDGNLAIGQLDCKITIWDLNNSKLLRTLEGHKAYIDSIALLANRNLASVSDDGEIRIWNPQNGQLVNTIRIHDVVVNKGSIFSIVQLNDGRLVSASRYIIKVWK